MCGSEAFPGKSNPKVPVGLYFEMAEVWAPSRESESKYSPSSWYKNSVGDFLLLEALDLIGYFGIEKQLITVNDNMNLL